MDIRSKIKIRLQQQSLLSIPLLVYAVGGVHCNMQRNQKSLQVCSVDVKGVFFGVITDVSSSVSVKEFQLKGEWNLGGLNCLCGSFIPATPNPPTQ